MLLLLLLLVASEVSNNNTSSCPKSKRPLPNPKIQIRDRHAKPVQTVRMPLCKYLNMVLLYIGSRYLRKREVALKSAKHTQKRRVNENEPSCKKILIQQQYGQQTTTHRD